MKKSLEDKIIVGIITCLSFWTINGIVSAGEIAYHVHTCNSYLYKTRFEKVIEKDKREYTNALKKAEYWEHNAKFPFYNELYHLYDKLFDE